MESGWRSANEDRHCAICQLCAYATEQATVPLIDSMILFHVYKTRDMNGTGSARDTANRQQFVIIDAVVVFCV